LQNKLTIYFNKAIQRGAIVGAGVSIVKDEDILISKGFGKRNLHKGFDVDSTTVFRLGSLSKGFASVLIADLKAERKLSWNDKIIDYIPEFRFGSILNTSNIKLEHILSHTSGTPYHSFTNLVEDGLSIATISEQFKQLQPLSSPGEQYSYQNAMFSLSQAVIQKVTGKTTKSLLTDRFFKPLAMHTVSMTHSDLMNTSNKAFPYVKRGKHWKQKSLRDSYYNAVTAGGINASANDMAKWMQFLLGNNPKVIRKEAIKEVFKPYISFKNLRKYYQKWPGHIKSSYGFGWRIHELQESSNKKTTIWHHGGSVNNFRNEIALFPETDLGICVLLNSQSKISKNVIPDLYQLIKDVYIDMPENKMDIVDIRFNDNE